MRIAVESIDSHDCPTMNTLWTALIAAVVGIIAGAVGALLMQMPITSSGASLWPTALIPLGAVAGGVVTGGAALIGLVVGIRKASDRQRIEHDHRSSERIASEWTETQRLASALAGEIEGIVFIVSYQGYIEDTRTAALIAEEHPEVASFKLPITQNYFVVWEKNAKSIGGFPMPFGADLALLYTLAKSILDTIHGYNIGAYDGNTPPFAARRLYALHRQFKFAHDNGWELVTRLRTLASCESPAEARSFASTCKPLQWPSNDRDSVEKDYQQERMLAMIQAALPGTETPPTA